METIVDAKKFLRKNFNKGCECPCCGQFVKLYNFKLSSSQVVGLIYLYKLDKENPDSFFKVKDIERYKEGFGGGSFAKGKHWGLITDELNDDTSKRTSGLWRITERGRKFVEGTIVLPHGVKLYNKKKYGYDKSKLINIKEALGKKFDYKELMDNI